MLTFEEFNSEQAKAPRNLVRTGSALMFARRAHLAGSRAEANFKRASLTVTVKVDQLSEDQRWQILLETLASISKGLEETRQQLGAISAQIGASELL